MLRELDVAAIAQRFDLNPIEELWSYFKFRLGVEFPLPPANVVELKRRIIVVWEAIPLEMINNFVLSFKGKLRQCVRNQGASSH